MKELCRICCELMNYNFRVYPEIRFENFNSSNFLLNKKYLSKTFRFTWYGFYVIVMCALKFYNTRSLSHWKSFPSHFRSLNNAKRAVEKIVCENNRNLSLSNSSFSCLCWHRKPHANPRFSQPNRGDGRVYYNSC